MATWTGFTAVASKAAPTLSTDGVDLHDGNVIDEWCLKVWNAAGTGAMAPSLRGWVYDRTAALWFPLGCGADQARGLLNDGNPIAVITGVANAIRFTQRLIGLRDWDRFDLEIVGAVGGTGGTFSADLSAGGG
ncbi:MAG: hypothetical protein ACEQSX_17075 [Baekduiaceae bacterium]